MTDNSKHLIEFQQAECKKKKEMVLEAISFLLHKNETVNINKVARRSNVSRTFIYKHPELREAIETAKPASIARAKRHRILSGKERTEESKTHIINNLKRRVKDLESQVADLKIQNSKLRSYISEIEE